MCTYVCECVCGALEIGQIRLGLVAPGPAQAEKSPGAQNIHTCMCTHTLTQTRAHTHLPASKDKDVQAYSTNLHKIIQKKMQIQHTHKEIMDFISCSVLISPIKVTDKKKWLFFI